MLFLYGLFLLQFLIGTALLGESTRRCLKARDKEAAAMGAYLTLSCAAAATGSLAGVWHSFH